MKKFHNVRIQVFVKEGENEAEITSQLEDLVPFSLEEEKIKVERKVATGFQERKIVILTIKLVKEKHTNKFFDNFMSELDTDDKINLLKQKESRLDEGLDFYIRLDKGSLIKEGHYKITESGDCFHIKLAIAVFPKNRSNGLKAVDNLFR